MKARVRREAELGALSGRKVVDLTRVLAGPLCTMWLGDMGADVIKIERPGAGDDTRSWGPPFAGTESAYYLGVNRNKRSLTLDLNQEEGLSILRKLIIEADMVVDNFKMGTLDRWGLTDAWFDENAPKVVRCTISGYGSSGPKAGKPGYDFILQAETGLMAITGDPEGGSMKLGVAIVDICTGMLATISILGALDAATRTGQGQRTEVSLHDTGIQMLANVAANHLVSGEEALRFGNGHPNIVPYRTFPTSDGELALAVGNDAQFARLAELVGHAEWATDERFIQNRDRVKNRLIVDGMVAEAMLTRTRAEWQDLLGPAGIPAGPINTVSEALSSEQTMARQMVASIDHPDIGQLQVPGIPFQFFGTPAEIRQPPPRLGEHTREILEELKIVQETVEALVASGVVTMEED